MAIDPINHYSLTTHGTAYDEEAMSLLELVSRMARKLNDCIAGVNGIPDTIAADVVAHIENGDFAAEIDNLAYDTRVAIRELTNEFTVRLDELLGSVTEGSTTLDAELIDIRSDDAGNVHPNAGHAVRERFRDALRKVETDNHDADSCTDPGIYFCSGGDWTNLPEGETAGVILSIADRLSSYRKYQLFISYGTNRMYTRYMVLNVYQPWSKPVDGDALFQHIALDNGATLDADACFERGSYIFGSGQTVSGVPNEAAAGLLLVYKGATAQTYQICVEYATSHMWWRVYGGTWSKWQRAITSADVDAAGGIAATVSTKAYTIKRGNDTDMFIYKAGAKGFVRYHFGRHVNAGIKLDTYRLMSIDLCDKTKTVIKNVSTIGVDVEGVVMIAGDTDHVGGAHGNETATKYLLFVDGKEYTFETVPNGDCDHIHICVKSNVFRTNGTTSAFERTKYIHFDRDGVHMSNSWYCWLTSGTITTVRGGMLSIDKSCFTHYVAPQVTRVPMAKRESLTTEADVTTNAKITDVTYLGDVVARHWAGTRGGEAAKQSTLIHDYGTRYKSYFNCYDGLTLPYTAGTLDSENHFDITY